jgi:hypothetical protein
MSEETAITLIKIGCETIGWLVVHHPEFDGC